MERLTDIELNAMGNPYYRKCEIKHENGECDYDCVDCEVQIEVDRKLKEYEDLEEQGLLLRLPCKVGQTVYAFAYPRTDIAVVVEEEVEKFLVWENGMSIETDGGYYPLDEIGVYVFLTKEEAEAALARMVKENEWN